MASDDELGLQLSKDDGTPVCGASVWVEVTVRAVWLGEPSVVEYPAYCGSEPEHEGPHVYCFFVESGAPTPMGPLVMARVDAKVTG